MTGIFSLQYLLEQNRERRVHYARFDAYSIVFFHEILPAYITIHDQNMCLHQYLSSLLIADLSSYLHVSHNKYGTDLSSNGL
jgi:hypothetical protein